jgi:hypothetical protein
METTNLDPLLANYLVRQLDIKNLHPAKAKPLDIKLLMFTILSVWSLVNILRFIVEYLDANDDDGRRQGLGIYGDAWWWPPV